MSAPGMSQMSAVGMQNMANMGGMNPQMTPQQQQQMLHSQQHPGMQQQFHPQQHQMGLSPQQQQILMQQQQISGQQPMHQMQQQGPGVPMQTQGMQPGRPQMAPGQQGPPPQQPELTPVLQAKLLVPQLKEALTNLMKVTAQNFHQNGLIDACSKSAENPPQKLDKYLEEFYAVCDQMELNLRLAIECNNASADSAKHTPRPVQTSRQDPSQPDTQTYAAFLNLARVQVKQAQEVRDLLLEGARKLGGEQSGTHPP